MKNLNVNIDLSTITVEFAILKAKIDSINYAIGLLLDERQIQKLSIVEKIHFNEEMIKLFEKASDFDENSLLVEHIKIKKELEELEMELSKLQ